MTTKIQWCDETWNPIVGCSRISEGCQNCYAATAAKSARLQQFNQYKLVGNWDGSVQFVESQLLKPLGWKQPKKIFVCSMADIFHKSVPDEWVDKMLAIAALCPQHTFQILTKRPARMMAYFSHPDRLTEINFQISKILKEPFEIYQSRLLKLPLPNVWLGVSVENQLAANTRIKFLTQTPAAVRFLSCEPLLERLNLSKWVFDRSETDITPIDWVIVGGESGSGSRPCHLNWIRSIVDQCYQSNTPVFVKQLGSNAIDSVPINGGQAQHQIKTSDRKGSDISQFTDINFRQFPI